MADSYTYLHGTSPCHVMYGASAITCSKHVIWGFWIPVVEALVPHVLAQHTAICCQPSNSYPHVVINLEDLALV